MASPGDVLWGSGGVGMNGVRRRERVGDEKVSVGGQIESGEGVGEKCQGGRDEGKKVGKRN